MKYLLLLLVAVVAVTAYRSPKDQFDDFCAGYGKYYSGHEYVKRLEIFKMTLLRIEEQNRVNAPATFAINEFSDLTVKEFTSMYANLDFSKVDPNAPVADLLPEGPKSVDWRTKGAVTPIKNQGQCGSCWAFSTTGNLEGQWFLAGNKLIGISEQQLVDCDHNGDHGCAGGLMSNAFEYIISNGGIDSEASYPYTARDGSCKWKAPGVTHMKNWTMIAKDEKQMASYCAAKGPISIAVDAASWSTYHSGIYSGPCGNSLDHGVLIVGYGTSGGTPYWIVKNSWGTSWGMSGFMQLKRGVNECGCNQFVCSAIIH
jgi:C1A family cysteine protease